MALFTTYQVKRELEVAAPILAVIVVAMAVEDAIEQQSLKPLTDLAGDLMEGIFG
jgi:hypothetical protein